MTKMIIVVSSYLSEKQKFFSALGTSGNSGETLWFYRTLVEKGCSRSHEELEKYGVEKYLKQCHA